MNLVIWCGPVTAANLKTAKLPESSKLVVFNQGIGKAGPLTGGQPIGSSHFAALGQSVGGSLRTLLAKKQLDLDAFATVTLAGFSAAHGLINSLLQGPEATRVDALLGADAYYTAANLAVKKGYRAHFERAAAGNALAILTTSNTAGANYPSASAAAEKLVEGLDLAPMSVNEPLPAPERAFGKLGALWCDYGAKYKHGQHATVLAPLFITNVVTPYINRKTGGGESGDDDAIGALAALGFLFAGLS